MADDEKPDQRPRPQYGELAPEGWVWHPPAVGPLLTAGGIIQAVIWAVSAGLSIRLLLRNRVSYYVPLLAGVVAFIAMIIILFMVVSTDPALLEFYGGVTTPTPGISTPAPGATP